MKKNIIVGTANLVNRYGFEKNKLELNQFKKILNYSKNKKIKISIDTALGYNFSVNAFKKLKISNNKITNKIPAIKNETDKKKILKALSEQKKLFNIKIFHIILAHNENYFLNRYSQLNINFLTYLKKNKYTQKIGISIYSIENLNKILKKFRPDYIQVPANIFDKRFLDKNFQKRMKKLSIKIQYRSIFLQGVLARNKIPTNINFDKISINSLNKYYSWSDKKNMTPLKACLNFVYLKRLKNVVIGVNSFEQFKEIINFNYKKISFPDFNIKQSDKNLLLRMDKWKKN